MSNIKQRLQQGINALSLDIADPVQDKMIQFIELIAKWNNSFNLTAIRHLPDMVDLHLLDSLTVVPHIQGQHILDVGAGAGLPGIVLALCYPEKEFVLIDTNGKKTRFMTQAKIELGLKNVEVVHARVDDYGINDSKINESAIDKNQPLKPFDVIISRAFASISDMLGYVDHLVTTETTVLAMKADSENEISQMPTAYQIVQNHDLVIPGLQAKRQLLVIKKDQE